MALMFTLGVEASALQEQISVLQDRGVSVTVDGTNLNLGDKAPLIYNGTTYLPVRAVAEAIGKEVNWNNDLRQVQLFEKSDVVTEPVVSEPVVTEPVVKDVIVEGQSFDGVESENREDLTIENYYVDYGAYFKQGGAIFNIDDMLGTVEFKFMVLTDADEDLSVTVFGTNSVTGIDEILFDSSVPGNEVGSEFTVPLRGIFEKVKIQVNTDTGKPKADTIIIGNIKYGIPE